MAINGINTYSTKFRLSGLATGLDTDQMVSDLMRVERMPIDKLYQKKQVTEWKRDSYREVTNLLRGIKDEFLDFLRPGNNMLSQATFKRFSGTSSDASKVTVSGTTAAVAGSHTISVTNLATAAVDKSSTGVSKVITGDSAADFNAALGKSFNIDVDGTSKTVTIDSTVTDLASFQALLDKTIGSGKVSATADGGGILSINPVGGSGVNKLTLTSTGSNNALTSLGFGFGATLTNRLNVSDTLETASLKMKVPITLDGAAQVNMTINGKAFTFSKTTSISSMMSQINNDSAANVTMQYDEISDTFKFTSKSTGAGTNIQLSETGSTFLAAAGFTLNGSYYSGSYTAGLDAKAKIDGQDVTRSTNSFAINGINYTLLKAHDDPANQSETISVALDVNGVYDNVKKFVDKYNDVIGKINSKLTEKYDREYQPLTEEQKETMNEDDIKKWEEKAKTGLLRGDSMLQRIVYDMRRALSDGVEGLTTSLSTIGIKTGTYQDKGKLTIDETKLKAAITNDPDAVMNLFSKQSDISSNLNLDSTQRDTRYKNEGLAYRISDIIDNNIRTIRDINGKKGILLEKAGIEKDITEFNSLMYKEIDGYNNRIYELLDKLSAKEDNYYKKFAALEKAISRMNSQSSWLASQFGGGK